MPDLCPLCKTPLVEGCRFCHHCGVPLTGEQPRMPASALSVVFARIFIILSAALYCAAWIADIKWGAEPAAALGWSAAAGGFVLLALGGYKKYTQVAALGLFHVGVAVFGTLLVVIFSWSPLAARVPFGAIGLGYLPGMLPFSWIVWKRLPAARGHPRQCPKCGYMLYGLIEPRCPECGTPCDLL